MIDSIFRTVRGLLQRHVQFVFETIEELTNKKLETSLKNLSALYQASELLAKALDTSEIYYTVSKIFRDVLTYDEFSLMILDDMNAWLEIKAASGFKNKSKIRGMRFKMGEGVCGQAAARKKIIYVPNKVKDERYLHYKKKQKEEGSFISIPLLVGSRVVGVLNVGSTQKNDFSGRDIQFLESLANQIAVAYDRSRLYTKTKELAVRDELTGLYNRRHFYDVLRMEWKRGQWFEHPLSILMIDVDHFKQYNDQFGHLEGDKALEAIGRLLSKNIREVDTLARVGGEEFVVLLIDTQLSDALHVAEKIRRLIEKAVLGGKPLTVSIGVSAYPGLAHSEEELVGQADIALYRAKSQGGNRAVLFKPPLKLQIDSLKEVIRA